MTVSSLPSSGEPRGEAPAPTARVPGSSPRQRTFVVLRSAFWITAAYLLLVARDFAAPPPAISLGLVAVLASNLLLLLLAPRRMEGVGVIGGVILLDIALVTLALVYSGEFGSEFFLLYFGVLLLAALGESLPLIVLAAGVGTVIYFWLAGGGFDARFWTSDTLIRFPFLLMAAAFVGYFVVRLRREKQRTVEEERVSAGLEEARLAIAVHARQVERSNRRLEVEVRERRRAEKDLEAANLKLKRVSQTKTDFISIVSHELRTPLASIKNCVDLLASGKAGELNEAQERFVTMTERNTARLTAIITDLLDLSRIEAGRMEFDYRETEIAPLLELVRRNLESAAQEGSVELRVSCDDPIALLWCDAGRIEQVVTNLVNNALRHTPEGGWVTMSARRLPKGAEISVEDTGVGISLDDQARIFERFYQVGDNLTRGTKGAGLGLSIVKQLVAGHGSRIHVDSRPGEGSRFWFRLPTLSSRTVEMLDFESKVMYYRTQAGFFTVLVLRLGSVETKTPSAFPNEKDVRRVFELAETHFRKRADNVVYQPAHDRIVLAMLMTPMSGAMVVKARLVAMLEEKAAEGHFPEVIVSGPACFPDDGPTGHAVVEHAIQYDGETINDDDTSG